MYIQWLVHGVPDAPKATPHITARAKEILQESESRNDWDAGVEVARQYDPERVDKLPRNDWYRLRRFIEVALALKERENRGSGEQQQQEQVDDTVETASVHSTDSTSSLTNERKNLLEGLDVRCFFLTESREDLCRTIDERCEQMLWNGLVQEVAGLLREGKLLPEHTVSKAIGYRQTIDYLAQRGLEDRDARAFNAYIE